MLAFRFISSSLKGVSALATNQFGIIISSSTTPSKNFQFNQAKIDTDIQKQQYRSITLNSRVDSAHVATVGKRAQKITAALMEAEIDLPVKPKKPITPWVAFVKDRKDQVLSQKQGMTAAEMAQRLSREWKNLDRSRYEREYNDRREIYLKEVEDYKNALTDQHREYLAVKRSLIKENKALKSIRKTKPPKLPRTCTNLFTQERWSSPEVQEELKTRPATEILKDLFKEYRELSPERKEKYVIMQQEDKIRFKNEFLRWYETVKDDKSLSHAAREQADIMKAKFEALSYI